MNDAEQVVSVREGLGCVIEYTVHDYHLNFRVVEIAGWPTTDGGTDYLYQNDNGEFVEDRALASNYVNGSIKWDGCSHLYFGEANNAGYIHVCGRGSFEKLRDVLDALWTLAAENVPTWSAEIAG